MSLECYFCAEDNASWCKVCEKPYCKECHNQSEQSWKESEYLSPHEWYEKEIRT